LKAQLVHFITGIGLFLLVGSRTLPGSSEGCRSEQQLLGITSRDSRIFFIMSGFLSSARGVLWRIPSTA
jgi:hypothetical protein